MASLKTHSKYHAEERPYRCIPCGKGFIFKHQLKRHMKEQHCLEEDMFEEIILKQQFITIVTDCSDQQSKDSEITRNDMEKVNNVISLDYDGTNSVKQRKLQWRKHTCAE